MKQQEFIYTMNFSKEDRDLCSMEMRAFFGEKASGHIIKSSVNIDPNRSPFIKERIDVLFEGKTIADIIQQASQIHLGAETFKVIFVKINDLPPEEKIEYEERLAIERQIGWEINGEANLRQPDRLFGVIALGGKWYFGTYRKNQRVWLQHVKKPREYSTALSARDARAIANIAVPRPDGVQAIDPCCGIGTVLVEALSMGIQIEGRDINPLVTTGSRENIAHFGLAGKVVLGPISDVNTNYDVAIIDMPYNLYTHATKEEQQDILFHARRFAEKVVVVTIDTIDEMIMKAGFTIQDRCIAKKGQFSRQILLCR